MGNGASDISATVAGILANAFEISYGELVGSGFFVQSVVLGTVILFAKELFVDKLYFVKDVIYYILTVVFILIFCSFGKLNLFQSIFMILFYVYLFLFCTLIQLYSFDRSPMLPFLFLSSIARDVKSLKKNLRNKKDKKKKNSNWKEKNWKNWKNWKKWKKCNVSKKMLKSIQSKRNSLLT